MKIQHTSCVETPKNCMLMNLELEKKELWSIFLPWGTVWAHHNPLCFMCRQQQPGFNMHHATAWLYKTCYQ